MKVLLAVPQDDGTIELNVKVKEGALYGTAILKVLAKGGKTSVSGNKLHIEKADEATIWLVAATNFVNPKDVSGNPQALCNNYLSGIANKTFEQS